MPEVRQNLGLIRINGRPLHLDSKPWKLKLDEKSIRESLKSRLTVNKKPGIEACAVNSVLERPQKIHPKELHLHQGEFAEIQAQIAYKLMERSLHKARKADRKQHRQHKKQDNADIKRLKAKYKHSIDEIFTLMANNTNKSAIDNNIRELFQNFKESLKSFDEEVLLDNYNAFMSAAKENNILKNKIAGLQGFESELEKVQKKINQYDESVSNEDKPTVEMDSLRRYYQAQELDQHIGKHKEVISKSLNTIDSYLNLNDVDEKFKGQLDALKGELTGLQNAESGRAFLENAQKFRDKMTKDDSALKALEKLKSRNDPTFGKQTKKMKKIAKAAENLEPVLASINVGGYSNPKQEIKDIFRDERQIFNYDFEANIKTLRSAAGEKQKVANALEEARKAFLTQQVPNRIQAQSNRPLQSASNGSDTFLPGRAAHSQQQASREIMQSFKSNLGEKWKITDDTQNAFTATIGSDTNAREARVSQSGNDFSFSGDAAGGAFQQFIESGDNRKDFNITITGGDEEELKKFVEQLIKDGIEINDTTKVKIGSEEPISLNNFVESSDNLKRAKEQREESSVSRRATASGA